MSRSGSTHIVRRNDDLNEHLADDVLPYEPRAQPSYRLIHLAPVAESNDERETWAMARHADACTLHIETLEFEEDLLPHLRDERALVGFVDEPGKLVRALPDHRGPLEPPRRVGGQATPMASVDLVAVVVALRGRHV
jgi:hypothetical protein